MASKEDPKKVAAEARAKAEAEAKERAAQEEKDRLEAEERERAQVEADRAKAEAEAAAAEAAKKAKAAEDKANPGTVAVNVPSNFDLRLADHSIFKFRKGPMRVPAELADHPYALDHGVTKV